MERPMGQKIFLKKILRSPKKWVTVLKKRPQDRRIIRFHFFKIGFPEIQISPFILPYQLTGW
jgi:hypothetical protein